MNIEKSFLGEFTFNNCRVFCEVESIVDKISGTKIKQLVVKSDCTEINMSYSVGDGLKIINSSRKKNNPLGEFLGLNINNLEEVENFISRYGYIYHVSKERYTPINIDELRLVQERLLAFVLLINNQTEFQKNNKDLLNAVIYILLKDYQNYTNIDNKANSFLPIDSEFDTYLKSASTPLTKDHSSSTVISTDDGVQIIFSRYSETLQNNIDIDFETIQNIYQEKSTPHWCTRILELFYSLDILILSDRTKKKIDFIFGLIYLIGPFCRNDINLESNFTIDTYTSIQSNSTFLKSIESISKILISEEFERALQDIKFTYNTLTMTPDWKLPSLMSALYFSIYYKNSKDSIYRICANEYCNQYFQVSSTNGTKKHCCDNCRDSKNSRKNRARKKQGK